MLRVTAIEILSSSLRKYLVKEELRFFPFLVVSICPFHTLDNSKQLHFTLSFHGPFHRHYLEE